MFCTVPSVGVCICMLVHLPFSYQCFFILLMFKDPQTTKLGSWFSTWRLLKSNDCCRGIINDANNFVQWLGLMCLPWGSVQSTLTVSHVSPSNTVSCGPQMLIQSVLLSCWWWRWTWRWWVVAGETWELEKRGEKRETQWGREEN